MEEDGCKTEMSTIRWLDKIFLESILRTKEDDNSLTVITSEVKCATASGDNYMSELYRAHLEVRSQKRTEKKNVSLIIKCTPSRPSIGKLISKLGVFEREEQMYRVVLPDMLLLLNKASLQNYQPFSAECLYSIITPTSCVVILEDLKHQGFTMAERISGLNLSQSLFVIRTLARFHAASVAVYQKNPHYFSIFKNRVGSDTEELREVWMDDYFKGVLKSLADEVEAWFENGENYPQRLRHLADNIKGKLYDVTKREEEEFNVLTHGDMWVNNIMFRHSGSTEDIQDIRFVDFQLPHWTSPALDLLYFLYTSPAEDLLDQHHILVEAYHSALGQTLEELGLAHLQPTLRDLQEQMEKRMLYAMFAAVAVMPVVLCNPNRAMDMDQVFKNDVQEGIAKSKLHSSEAYKAMMKKILPIFDAKNLL
ncbi:uncharacterized protein [Periplaneta americana]|uniref:uncharacterized protein n=1 Tax=Periplaneta americana TaxID=6978 RepID=UPI0037E99066